MFQNKAVRSVFALLALCGMVSACGSKSGGSAPSVPPSQSTDGAATVLSQEVTQKASVKIASIKNDQGADITRDDIAAMASEGLGTALAQLEAVEHAVVTKEAVLTDGQIVERVVLDLRDKTDSILKFQADPAFTQISLASSRAEFPAKEMKIAMVEGKVAQMTIHLEAGRAIDVVLAFGAEQEQAKQEEQKQEEQKQDESKQEQVKQDEAKQDDLKGEDKSDESKQEQNKEDKEDKGDESKQEQVKEGKEDKSEESKQEQVKDQSKQDQSKQEQSKKEDK